ncbi:MAG TPA: hypothetical protein VFD58_05225 [Blastocatellia bacterium]|nr:hypothetical protein [Blastocatellia bacterium]
MSAQNTQEDSPRRGEKPEQVNAKNLPDQPGRTPGTAEGDRETVEESLRDKEEKRQGGKA